MSFIVRLSALGSRDPIPFSGNFIITRPEHDCYSMTKAELIAALTELLDEAEILIEPCPRDRGWRAPEGELYGLEVEIVSTAEPENPAFALIRPDSTQPDMPRFF